MNTWPMIFRFCCGSVTSGQLREESLARIDDVQVGLEVIAEAVLDLFGLALRASRPLSTKMQESCGPIASEQQRGRHRRIDAAGKSADHAALADDFADRLDLALDERADPPRALAAADVPDEIAQDVAAVLACGSLRDGIAGRKSASCGAARRRRGTCRLPPAIRTSRSSRRPGRRGSSRRPSCRAGRRRGRWPRERGTSSGRTRARRPAVTRLP